MLKKYFSMIIFFFTLFNSFLYPEIGFIKDDEYIFEKADGGYDLYVKKKVGYNSILLTESQKDPSLKKTNYGLRTEIFHHCNGNELRILDDKVLQTQYDVFFLVDSTPEPHKVLKEAFHFFLPKKVIFGYDWQRKGELRIAPGVKINLRIFEKHFADYSGEFKDQWITLKLKFNTGNFATNMPDNFHNIADKSDGELVVKTDEDNLYDIFTDSFIDKINSDETTDVVFIIDTTLSMREEIPVFKQSFQKLKQAALERNSPLRIALILYKDYGDVYLNRIYPFTSVDSEYDKFINSIAVAGGDDIPEAVYEAICKINELDFQSNSRLAFLIADAPAHPKPRGKISQNDAVAVLRKNNVKLTAICLPYK